MTMDTGGGGFAAIIAGTALAGGVLSWRFGESFWARVGDWLRWW